QVVGARGVRPIDRHAYPSGAGRDPLAQLHDQKVGRDRPDPHGSILRRRRPLRATHPQIGPPDVREYLAVRRPRAPVRAEPMPSTRYGTGQPLPTSIFESAMRMICVVPTTASPWLGLTPMTWWPSYFESPVTSWPFWVSSTTLMSVKPACSRMSIAPPTVWPTTTGMVMVSGASVV